MPETKSRHCIPTSLAGSLYCGMWVANDCSCGCGLCGHGAADSGYHLLNQTQLLGFHGSHDTTSEGPANMSTSVISEDTEWTSAQQARNVQNKRKFCSEYNAKTGSNQTRSTPAYADTHLQKSPGHPLDSTRCPCPAGCLYEGEYGLATCLLCSPDNIHEGHGCCCPCAGCYPDSDREDNFRLKWQWVIRWVFVNLSTCSDYIPRDFCKCT